MTEQKPPEKTCPPDDICVEPFDLDDLVFAPSDARIERATRDGAHVGDVLRDDVPDPADPEKTISHWFARKVDALTGNLSDWQYMRCVHEARAFLVSRRRMAA
jgi:hypothetical protein